MFPCQTRQMMRELCAVAYPYDKCDTNEIQWHLMETSDKVDFFHYFWKGSDIGELERQQVRETCFSCCNSTM